MPSRNTNDKLLQIIQMIRDDIKNVREEVSRHNTKLDDILIQFGEFRTKLSLLPCNERKNEINALRKATEENTYFRIRVTAIRGLIYSGLIFVFVYVIPVIIKIVM